MVTSTSDWMERHVFSVVDIGVRTVASHKIALPTAGTNRRTATSNRTDHFADQLVGEGYIWPGLFVLFIVVWRKFHFFCGTASSMCVT